MDRNPRAASASRPPRTFASHLRAFLSTLLALVFAAAALVFIQASPAAAAITIECGDGAGTSDIYVLTNTTSTVNFGSMTSTTTAATATGMATIPASSAPNALGISSDGAYLYATYGSARTTASGTSSITVVRYNTSTGTSTTNAMTEPVNLANNATIARGAVNPANGYFYYTIGTSSYQDVYAVAPGSSSPAIVGRIANVTNNTNTGDITFDQSGNLYIVMGPTLKVVPNIGTTVNNAEVTATTLVSALAGSTSISANGIAFSRSGTLYVTAGSTFYGINASTGAQLSTGTITLSGFGTGGSVIDAASCQNPNTLTLKKNVASRYDSTDQFTTSISATGITTVTGTTTGTDTGLQDSAGEFAGPVVATSGLTYTLSETAASGSLSNYTTTYECTNADGTVLTSGTGTSFTYTYPTSSSGGLAVTCIFTNTAASKTASLSTTKTISTVNGAAATSATVLRPGDVVTYEIVTANSGGAAGTSTLTETVPANTTYTGTSEGWTCAATSANSTCTQNVTVAASASVTTYFTVTVASSVDSSTSTISNTVASSSGTCASCTASNKIYDPGLSVVKSSDVASVDAAGDTITYTFTVTNTGNVTIDNLAIDEGT
ncbi:MAG: hypothetical protein QM655_15275, partial [Nocardioidaceae bacterium]